MKNISTGTDDACVVTDCKQDKLYRKYGKTNPSIKSTCYKKDISK